MQKAHLAGAGQREAAPSELKQLAQDMIETMRASDGLGLAAEQVGETVSLCVVEIPEGYDREEEDEVQTVEIHGSQFHGARVSTVIGPRSRNPEEASSFELPETCGRLRLSRIAATDRSLR